MGYYANPPKQVVVRGRKINTASQEYDDLVNELKDDELLFAHVNRFLFEQAPHLYNKDEYEEFYSQHLAGSIIITGFYALSKTDAKALGAVR